MSVDFHDDLGETYLASLGPKEPPTLLKEAAWKESSDLLDRDFALIVVDGEGKEHRKYASFDPGNIAMSRWYLENADHGLPEVAVKVASANLSRAAGENPEVVFTDEERKYVIDERRVFVKDASKPSVPAKTEKTASSPVSPFDMLHDAQKNWADLDPYDRREAAVTLQRFEKSAGISVPDYIREYGGESLNPRFETLMKRRLDYIKEAELREGYERLAKVASAMNPDDVVNILYHLDQSASLTPRYGKNLPDPVLSVYGQEKQAMWSWIHGGDMVNERQLIDFGNYSYNWERLRDVFVHDVVEKFRKDPVGTFKAMPVEQQTILARLAQQGRYSSDGGA